jgi:hypothetical protein
LALQTNCRSERCSLEAAALKNHYAALDATIKIRQSIGAVNGIVGRRKNHHDRWYSQEFLKHA